MYKTGRTLRAGAWLPPVITGMVACLLVCGSAMLQPGNVRWLTRGDLAQSYLGWAFYRHAAWSWPPGANALYGVGLHTSVYYSDSIPLLAMLFKPWTSWLGDPFQYFGLWVLACFVLQAWFAWRLLGLATNHAIVKGLGVLFFVFAPPMLVRLDGHMALVGHWIVLAAIYLCLRPVRRQQAAWWAGLLAVAVTVHAYLFAIAGAIWLADVLQECRMAAVPEPTARRVIPWPGVMLVLAVVAFAAWLAGLFMVSGQGTQAEGFGYYKMNLLAPINGAGWSWLGLNFPQAAGEYEGFNYFGAGGAALLLLAAITAMARPSRGKGMPGVLWLVAVLLALAAITCEVGIGALQWRAPLPDKYWAALSRIPLQSTGRLFWAMYYVAFLSALFVVLRSFPVRWQLAILSCAVALQCVDCAAGIGSLRAALASRARQQAVPGLHGPFWDEAGRRYRLLRVLPLSKRADWEQLAFYAQSHHMGMDGVQLARIDMDRFLALYNQQQEALLSDRLGPDTLYLLDERELALARAAVPPHDAALLGLDGKYVLAPGWTASWPASAIDLRAGSQPTPYGLPFHSDFAKAGTGRLLLGHGWNATGEGLMSLADTAALFVPGGHDPQRPLKVTIKLHRANVGRSMAMELQAWFDGRQLSRCSMADGSCQAWAFDMPGTANPAYFRRIELRPGTPGAKLRIALDGISVE